MANFALLVTKPPFDSEDAYAAFRFAQAALDNGHRIDGVFFYSTGVYNASTLTIMMSDELDLHKSWLELNKRFGVPLYACISAANRRGILSSQEASEAGKTHYNVDKPFQISGLGEFFDMLHRCDRLVQF